MKTEIGDFPKTIIIGGSGFVASRVLELLPQYRKLLICPSEKELNILEIDSVNGYLKKHRPQAVINFAAHTNLDEAEKLRGDQTTLPWKLNVEGSQNVAKACKTHQAFLIHISTDAVFPGTKKLRGPYSEDTQPSLDLDHLSWYGYTKLLGEKTVHEQCSDLAIIRLSYPFGSPSSERDFAKKTLSYIKAGYSLFDDQNFTPTFLPDLAQTLPIILVNRLTGIFHVVCNEVTTPYEFGAYIAHKSGLHDQVKATSVDIFLQTPGKPFRPKLGGLVTEKTQATLNIKFHTWQRALDLFSSQIG